MTATISEPVLGDGEAVRTMAQQQAVAALAPADRADLDLAHLRERVSRELSDTVVAESGGLVRRRDGRPSAAVLWTDGRHPLTGHGERVLSAVVAMPDARADLAGLLAEAVAKAADDGVDALRAEVGDELSAELAEAGFTDHFLVTRKEIVPRPGDPDCVPLSGELRWFAVRCLADAVVTGLGTGPFATKTVGRPEVEQFVETRMATWDGRTALSYVAIKPEGGPVAHADVRLRTAAHHSGTDAMLSDVYVLPGERGHGWGMRLTGHVEGELASRGVRCMEGTVVLNGGAPPPGLLDQLTGAGWWVDRRSMTLRLKS